MVDRHSGEVIGRDTTHGVAPATDPAGEVQLYPSHDALSRDLRVAGRVLSVPKLSLALADVLVVLVALLAATAVNARLNPGDPTSRAAYTRLALASLPLWPLVLTQQLLYRARHLGRGIDELTRIVRAVALGSLLTGGMSIVLKIDIGRRWMFWVLTLTFVGLATERLAARTIFARARRRGHLLRPVLIAGRNAEGTLIARSLGESPDLGYDVLGFVEDVVDGDPGDSPLTLLGNPSRVMDAIERTGATGVIIAASALDVGTTNRLIRTLTEHGVHVELSSTLFDIAAHRLIIRPVGRIPMMYVEPVRRDGWRPIAKRIFDLTIAGLALVVTAPVMAVAAVAVKASSPGPVLFRQYRVGRDGELFEMFKLRTMYLDAEERAAEVADLNQTSGLLFKSADDPRVTPVGRILRRFSIDEIPQLLNVMKGDMSLVGPRPALPSEAAQWTDTLHNRVRVKPGITGMWQIGRGEGADHDATYERLDLYYVDNWSVVTDLAILLRTIPVVLSARNS